MCEVMQQISTSAPTSDSLSPGWSSTIYITQSHKMEERTHTDPDRVRMSRLVQKQVKRTLLRGHIWCPPVQWRSGSQEATKTPSQTFCEELLCNSSRLLDNSLRWRLKIKTLDFIYCDIQLALKKTTKTDRPPVKQSFYNCNIIVKP